MTTPEDLTRREFLKATAVAGASAALLASGNYAFAHGSDQLKVGLIGCGGRGSGAAAQALAADSGAVLTSMGDVFASQIANSLAAIKGEKTVASRVQVTPDHCFVGLE